MAGRYVTRVTSRLEGLILAVWHVVKYFCFYIPYYMWKWRSEIGDVIFIISVCYYGSLLFKRMRTLVNKAKHKAAKAGEKVKGDHKKLESSYTELDEKVKEMVTHKVMQKIHGGGPIVLNVPLCCEKCEEKVKNRVLDMEGVVSVHTDSMKRKVTVTGNVKPDDILSQIKKLDKRFRDHTGFWSH